MNQAQSAAFAGKARQKKISDIQTKINIAQEALKDIKPSVEQKPHMGTPLAPDTIAEGVKVRLNTKKIFADRGFASSQKKWRKFVQEHQDDEFTVKHDPRFGENPSLVWLEEDRQPDEYKFLWHVSDLEVVV